MLNRPVPRPCPSPYRLSTSAGPLQVDVCLFDKTGTITSDKLRAETLVTPQSLRPDSPPVAVSLGHSARSGGTAAGSERPGLAAEVRGESRQVEDSGSGDEEVFRLLSSV